MEVKKRHFEKFRKIHSKTPVPRYFFDKVSGLWPVNLLKKRLPTSVLESLLNKVPISPAILLKTDSYTGVFR